MNHLIIAPLFFFLGALVSWLFFAWRADREDNILTEMLMNQYRENGRLSIENNSNNKIIYSLESQAMRSRQMQVKATECIKMLTEELLKYKQQEKQKCR